MTTRETVFEIQRRDSSGRWRKAPGVPRVHTFGLARLRAQKLIRKDGDDYVLDSKHYTESPVRVRHVKTGDTWSV